jgi:hypothetical protein
MTPNRTATTFTQLLGLELMRNNFSSDSLILPGRGLAHPICTTNSPMRRMI